MTNSKLILIEGIAGSGKSTLGKKLYEIICKNNINVKFFHEFDPLNPIREINSKSDTELISKSLSKWRAFVKQHRNSHEVFIFDGILSQCFVAELILMATDEQTIMYHVRELVKTLEDSNSCVIYLYQENIKEAITKAYDCRNERWKKKIDTFISNTQFGRKKTLKGLSGYITFNLYYDAVLKRIMANVTIDRISVDTSQAEWSRYYEQISEFLSLPSLENDSIRELTKKEN